MVGAGVRERAEAAFARAWGGRPDLVVRAPGRVNLIGDHTDHQDGFVLPLAIDREVWLVARRVDEPRVRVVSAEEEGLVDIPASPTVPTQRGWGAYVEGVLWALAQEGVPPAGWVGALASDVPVGAGLSSSAALELAVALTATAVAGSDRLETGRLALLAQRAENDWVGMSCGIMDQLTVAAGVEGAALRIDCRSLEVVPVGLPEGLAVLVLDTGTRRELATSAYNTRRAECDEASAALGVTALRDAGTAAIDAAGLTGAPARRARHVVSENARVLEAAAALADGDAARVGALMAASHVSLREDYEVSTPELDAIVAAAAAQEGCHGARLTGAGFGGCAVALVEAGAAEAISAGVVRGYETATGTRPTVHLCHAAAGAQIVVDAIGGDR